MIKEKSRRTSVAGPGRTALLIILVLLLAAAASFAYWGSIQGGNVLAYHVSQPLNGAMTARVDIATGSGNLTIDRLTGGEQLLAKGTLQYLETQDAPTQSVSSDGSQASLTLRGGDAGHPWFSFPWVACNGATEWQVQLHPGVLSDITAHSGGGNLRLNLAGMNVARVSADTGGGNVDVVLPDNSSGLTTRASAGAGNVTVDLGNGITGSNTIDATSGAGNVVVGIPAGVAARIHATTGLGNTMVAPRFTKVDDNTYRSPDYDTAANRVEITVKSGAGNVSVNER